MNQFRNTIISLHMSYRLLYWLCIFKQAASLIHYADGMKLKAGTDRGVNMNEPLMKMLKNA